MTGTALIGYTGFVGSNLAPAMAFDELYNSANIDDIAHRSFDLVICAGARAEKWIGNKDPEADWRGIENLIDRLETVSAKEFVLISTTDVYPDPASRGDESEAIDPARNHAYGRNRFRLEEWSRGRFETCRILRLAALFGPGLKKNMVYDLINDNMVDRINPASAFQWYPIDRLADDIETVRRHDLDLVNLFPEPLASADILARLFPEAQTGPRQEPAPHYDVTTRYAQLFGGDGGYIMSSDASLAALEAYVQSVARTPA